LDHSPRNSGPLSFEDGLTELWNELTLDKFIDKTGLRELEPRLDARDFRSRYVREGEAVRQICAWLQSAIGTSDLRSTVQILVRELPDTRGKVVGQKMVQGLGWGGEINAPQFAGQLRGLFDSLFDFKELSNHPDLGRESIELLKNAVDAMASTISTLARPN
jgi:hypothetical protein